MKNGATEQLFEIRIRCEITGKIAKALLTKREISEGIDGYDMNLEDIGLALLNDLRLQMDLEPIQPSLDTDCELGLRRRRRSGYN